MTKPLETPFTAACIQMCSGRDPQSNLEVAADLVRQAASDGADLIMTPEMTNIIDSPRAAVAAKVQAEEDCIAVAKFAELAAETGKCILAGSLGVQAGNGKLANRSLLFAPDGRVLARYDKAHMFDVDLPNGERYRESSTFAAGDKAVFADLPWGRLGLTICYDVRFAYQYRMLAQQGCSFISVPAAFTVPTGSAHWHVLLRARAIETGCFVFAPAQSGTHEEGRKTFGHSLIVSPWGDVLADAGDVTTGIVMAEIDPAKVTRARGRVPALTHDKVLSIADDVSQAAAE
ncbi:MAG: carbon-nitrogen hydrolase family protein [Anderseniella sp.]